MEKTDQDKFAAVWLSHSTMSDFLKCPRLYYYINIYKNPKSGRKITMMNPHLALGQAVHGVLDELSQLPSDSRFNKDILSMYEENWKSVTGKKGGFSNELQEKEFKDRGVEMLQRVMNHPGPLLNKALKMKQDLPYYWFSEKDDIILCGKIDWIEYIESSDSIHIIDFKTGRRKEKGESLQLPIYLLLAKNCQSRTVSKMSYWYLDSDDVPEEVPIPDEDESIDRIMKVAQRIKLARQLKHFKCAIDEVHGCSACVPFESVIQGKGEFVGIGEYNKEIYILPDDAVTL